MANFWTSSQAAHLWTKEDLQKTHAKDRSRGLTAEQIEKLTGYHIKYICDLAKCGYPNGVRQGVAATACVFFRRFFLRNDFCDYDPRAVAPATLFLAAKVEETLLQARYLFQLMQRLAAKFPAMLPTMEVKVLMDLEMALLEDLDFQLVVWHPYTDLAALLQDAQQTSIAQNAWAVLNDSYRTDACLLYPPYVVALGCINMAAAMSPKTGQTSDEDGLQRWMEGLEVNLDQVYSATLELMRMYEPSQTSASSEEATQLLSLLRQ